MLNMLDGEKPNLHGAGHRPPGLVMLALLLLAGCGAGDGGEPADTSARVRAASAVRDVDASASDTSSPETFYTEGGKLNRADDHIAMLGSSLFGDRVNLYDGSTQFIQGDASIPGNSSLPVSIGRRYTPASAALAAGHFGDWELEIPRLHGVFSTSLGWTVGDNAASASGARCTQFGTPPWAKGTVNMGDFEPVEYWHGHFLYVPGAGSQEILVAGESAAAVKPTGPLANTGVTPVALTTKDRWTFICGTSMQMGGGEGFTAISPDGTRYRFDWMVTRRYAPLTKSSSAIPGEFRGAVRGPLAPPSRPASYLLPRSEVWILPTLVTDRFGNTVQYTYDPLAPWRLLKIEGSDGAGNTVRRLTLGYAQADSYLITRVSDGVREWNYSYSADGSRLTGVQLPDNSAWSFNMDALRKPIKPVYPAGTCGAGFDNGIATTFFSGDMVHPSGAKGTFRFSWVRHGRSYVDKLCVGNSMDENQGASYYPKLFDSFALRSKTLTGPGLPAADPLAADPGGDTWKFDYGPTNDSWSTCSGCPDTKTVTVTDPGLNRTRHTFGNRFRSTDGQMLKTEEGWNGSAALRTTVREYAPMASGPYPDWVGSSLQPRVEGDLSTRHVPEKRRSITQQGTTFVWQAEGFDRLARPVDVSRFSTLGFTRRERTDYADTVGNQTAWFTDRWVLGQVRSVFKLDAAGTVVEEVEGHEFDALTLKHSNQRSFGRVTTSFGYFADGTLASRTDALGHTTGYRDYKRGLPRSVVYADGATESAVVDDSGHIVSLTNAANTTTAYEYDAAGRLKKVTYPGGDSAAYHPTVTTYQQRWTAEYGLDPGHWVQTVATGFALTERFLDARWRPLLTRTLDTRNEADTRRVVVNRYDSEGRKTFESYPQRADAVVSDAFLPGTTSTYDALGRIVRQVQTGGGVTSTEYLDGFQRKTTNPRSFATTHAFQAFDEPREDHVVFISAPEGVSVEIQRDSYGKAGSITRSGGGKSVTRSYVYDAYHRLCKTIEPETGATVQGHDAADNLVWKASGQNFPGPGCESSVGASPRIDFSYDLRNRLIGTQYGDGSPSVQRTYTADGLLKTLVTPSTNWTYEYNNRRQLKSERLAEWWQQPEQGWRFEWGIDAHGQVASLTDGGIWGTLEYSPNALGQPTKVGGYASNVRHHPNGMVASYTLANGVAHSVSLNARQLPEEWRDAGPHGLIAQDRYSYDPNGNVTAIVDEQNGANSRSMPWYDGLDRLRQANGVWGAGRFDYDALDNLVFSQVGGRSLNHNIDAGTNRLSSLSGSQNIGISYDANGNVVQRGSQGFVFDIGNRLASAPGKASYEYDGHGRRTWVFWADGKRQFHGYTRDGKLLQTWHNTEGSKRYVYLGGKLIAEVAANGGPWATTYISTDALGSPVARTNEAGQEVSRTRYEPYGATAVGENPKGVGFTGHVNDGDTGLVYMQQRYYDPIAGRFLSVDPVVTDANTGGSFNRYVYGRSNPYKFIDPDGRFSFHVHWLITYFAAREAGYSRSESLGYANTAVMVDFEPGSQLATKEAVALHGMRIAGQDVAEARQNNLNLIERSIASGDLGRAAHAIQDPFAQQHRDFPVWSGFDGVGDFLVHILSDSFPSGDEISGAYRATVSMLRRAKNQTGSSSASGGTEGGMSRAPPLSQQFITRDEIERKSHLREQDQRERQGQY